MPVRRLLATFAVPLLLVGALAACSSEPDVKVEPKLPTPSATSPTATEAAQESPEAFIRRWAQVEAAMENSGDTAEYRALSRGCKACESLADQVESFYDAGGFVKWEGWAVRSVQAWGGSKRQFAVDVRSSS